MILSRMNRIYRPAKPDCYRPKAGETAKAVSFKYVDKAYFLLLIGYTIAFFLFVIETFMVEPTKSFVY